MRFQAIHKLLSYALPVSAVITMLVADAITWPATFAFAAACMFSWRFDPGTRAARALDRVAPATHALVVLVSMVQIWRARATFIEGDPGPVFDMVLILLGYKLFGRRSNRDYFHIYVLSFLLVLGSAVAATSILFAAGFSLFVLVATWTLIVFHLRREMEDNYLVRHVPAAPNEHVEVDRARVLNSRRVVGRSFFLATSLVSVAVLAGSALTFFAVPRIGAGFLFGGARKGRQVVGFSDQVVLGQHGVISNENQNVALRVQVPHLLTLADDEARTQAIANMYWRGTVYDTYADGQWVRSSRRSLRTHLGDTRALGANLLRAVDVRDPFEHPKTAAQLANLEQQIIDVVGLNHPVAFALDRPVALAVEQPKEGAVLLVDFEPRFSGEVALRVMRRFSMTGRSERATDITGSHYIAFSIDPTATASPDSALDTKDIAPADLAPYLEVPEDLSPQVAELARRITAGARNAADKVRLVQDYLLENYRYTTELHRTADVADPTEDFLFHLKEGHCEYFASAAALLLRISGVPTRYINGFLGGEWNALSGHVTVRDNRAHSWVEAYVGRFGWARVDATPPGPAAPRMSRVRQLIDAMEQAWTRWVVDFDLSRQVTLARNLGKTFGSHPGRSPGSPRSFAPSPQLAGVVLGVLGLAWLGYFVRLWRRRRTDRARIGPPAEAGATLALYAKALNRLERAGLVRRPAETPRAFADRVAGADVEGGAAFARLSHIYGEARYGAHPPDATELARLAEELGRLGRRRPGGPRAAA